MSQAIWCVGIATQDHIFGLNTMPDAPGKFRAQAFKAVGGGVGATAAVAVARLGGAVALLTRLGADAIGEAIVLELQNYGVECGLVQRFNGRCSPISAVLVDRAGERLIVNYQDPAMPDEIDWLPAILPPDVAVVLADTRWINGSRAMLQRA